jgi:hypothetical protein
MTIPRFSTAAVSMLLSAGALLAQDAEAPAPVAPQPVAPAAPLPPPEDLQDPFGSGGATDGTNLRLSAGLTKAAQAIKVIGLGKSAAGRSEAMLRLGDKDVVSVRPGESFTFIFGAGLALPCEVVSVTEQEVGILVNGQTELRLR